MHFQLVFSAEREHRAPATPEILGLDHNTQAPRTSLRRYCLSCHDPTPAATVLSPSIYLNAVGDASIEDCASAALVSRADVGLAAGIATLAGNGRGWGH